MVSKAVGFIFGSSSLLLSVLMGVLAFKERPPQPLPPTPPSPPTLEGPRGPVYPQIILKGNRSLSPHFLPRLFEELSGASGRQKALCGCCVAFLVAALALMCVATCLT